MLKIKNSCWRAAATLCCALTLASCDGAGRKPKGDMVLIPAGEFIMGSDKTDSLGMQKEYGFVDPLYLDEHPLHKVVLPAFLIDKYEVTNAQYKDFALQTKRTEPSAWVQNGYNVREDKLRSFKLETLRWAATQYFKLDRDTQTMSQEEILAELQKIQQYRDKLPVSNVTWHDANDFCRWQQKRLPSEAEWEKAARGTNGLEYPWGNDWEAKKLNIGAKAENEDEPALPSGSYPDDKSTYGVFDLAGNVSEWVDDWYKPYPGNNYVSKDFGEIHKVKRGGEAGIGHYSLSYFFRGAVRNHADPATASSGGFRCAAGV